MIKELLTYDWYSNGFNAYQPHAEIIEKLKEYGTGYFFEMYYSVACPDTHTLIPQFCKVFKEACFKGIRLIEFKLMELPKAYGRKMVNKVPTIVIVNKNEIVGEIIETIPSHTTIEALILEIIKNHECTQKLNNRN